MRTKSMKFLGTRLLAALLALCLCAALAVAFAACAKEKPPAGPDADAADGAGEGGEGGTLPTPVADPVTDALWTHATYAEATLPFGEGKQCFSLTVVVGSHSVKFTIRADEGTTVGKALVDCGLIAGDEGPYGLYVKTVNGMTVDPDAGNAYWSFSKDGTALLTGVDSTPFTDGDDFALTYATY